jgi:hypothetical protein
MKRTKNRTSWNFHERVALSAYFSPSQETTGFSSKLTSKKLTIEHSTTILEIIVLNLVLGAGEKSLK